MKLLYIFLLRLLLLCKIFASPHSKKMNAIPARCAHIMYDRTATHNSLVQLRSECCWLSVSRYTYIVANAEYFIQTYFVTIIKCYFGFTRKIENYKTHRKKSNYAIFKSIYFLYHIYETAANKHTTMHRVLFRRQVVLL